MAGKRHEGSLNNLEERKEEANCDFFFQISFKRDELKSCPTYLNHFKAGRAVRADGRYDQCSGLIRIA